MHDVLKPAGTFADLKHLKGKTDTNIALDYHLRRGDSERRSPRPIMCSSTRSARQQVLHVPLEPFVSVARCHATTG